MLIPTMLFSMPAAVMASTWVRFNAKSDSKPTGSISLSRL